MALAHIRNGQIIRRYGESKGWVELEDGSKASPPVAGFVKGNDKIVEIVEQVTDTSTGEEKVATSETTVEVDRVLVTRTVRDKTTEELDADKDVMVLSQADQVLGRALFVVLNEVRALKSQPAVTKAQFLSWLKGQV